MATVTVRFRGICCFIDPTNGEPFKKRVVLPNAASHQHSVLEKHLPIIEFLADDLKEPLPPEMKVLPFTRPGDDAQYACIEIKEPVCIELIGTKPGEVMPGINMKDAMIHIDSLSDDALTLKKTLLGPAAKVSRKLATAVIDLPAGVLMAGPPEASITKFPKTVKKFKERRIARWIEHITEVDGDFGLKLTPLGGSTPVPSFIWFKNTAQLITIAHEPLRMIVGHFVPGKDLAGERIPEHGGDQHKGNQATGHFDMYWDLIADPPDSRPVPEPFLGTGPGCAPANKP